MSGFEVAGIVLGAIPLIISALEHYDDVDATIGSIFGFEEVWLDLVSSLTECLTIFRLTCETMLAGIILSEVQVVDLLEENRGWDDKELRASLENRLGRKEYQVYEASVQKLWKNIKRLGKRLGLRENLTLPYMEGGVTNDELRRDFFGSAMRRFSGGIRAGKNERLIEKIRADIYQIRFLVEGALKLGPQRRERSSSSNSKYWLYLRDHTERLYTAFDLIWPRGCTHIHSANLRLELPRKTKPQLSNPEFGFLFSALDDPELCGSDVTWRDVNILAYQAPTYQLDSNPAPSRRRVQYSQPDIDSPKAPYCKTLQVDDLCKGLSGSIQKQCLGYVSYGGWDYHIHHEKLHQSNMELIPLLDIFGQNERKEFSIRDKCILGLSLALAVLQLYDTEWLHQDWGLRDVHLNPHGRAELYITKAFNPKLQTTAMRSDQTTVIRNQTTFALGVALIEISYCKPFPELRKPWNPDKGPSAEFCIAHRIIAHELPSRETSRFIRAVQDCISPDPIDGGYDFANPEFRKKFYEDVVAPLRAEYDILFHDSTVS